MVYVLNKDGSPLMPTNRNGKVYRLLKAGKAKVVSRTPFTIQLLYETATNETQPISLGVDAGSKHIGLSATTEDKVLYEADIKLRDDIVDLIASRRALRRSRRNRKTRYRPARFNNRKKCAGWLAPSVRQKIDCHLSVVAKVHKILPVSDIVVEVASFDIQKINNPDIAGTGYQQGDQFGFWNVREYVLYRDNHTCQCCKGKSKDKILNVHHIESRKTGGNAPNNLVTLCETCHKLYHQGKIQLPKTIKRGASFRDAAFMGIMRWAFYNKLKETYPTVYMTYGYLTKNIRIQNGLPKDHYIDARCISGHPLAVSDGVVYYTRQIRCHNRQIHQCTARKGGVRLRNQAEYLVHGYRLFDKVRFRGQECFVSTRRVSGSFRVCTLDGKTLSQGVTFRKLRFIETRKSYLVQRSSGAFRGPDQLL